MSFQISSPTHKCSLSYTHPGIMSFRFQMSVHIKEYLIDWYYLFLVHINGSMHGRAEKKSIWFRMGASLHWIIWEYHDSRKTAYVEIMYSFFWRIAHHQIFRVVISSWTPAQPTNWNLPSPKGMMSFGMNLSSFSHYKTNRMIWFFLVSHGWFHKWFGSWWRI